jgi:hypothetical protein
MNEAAVIESATSAFERRCKVMCLRSSRSAVRLSTILSKRFHAIPVLLALCLCGAPCLAQEQPPAATDNSAPHAASNAGANATVTIPAGTRLALVLTQPVQSRILHRGDNIYAQTSSPVGIGNEVVIPAGTFVQGIIEKLENHGGRGELRLQSMSITFPDGYAVPIAGPMTVETNEGYAVHDTGQTNTFLAIILPAAGAGIGTLVGHFAAGSPTTTITSTNPPGCTGPPPGCLTSSVTGPAGTGKDMAIGAVVGGAAGGLGTLALLYGSRHFFLDVGTPAETVLQHPITLKGNEVTRAVEQSAQHPVAQQVAAPKPMPPPPPPLTADHGTCYTPGTPGTPTTVMPGVPGPDGIPGPPTVIPGTPPTPGTPYPCP